MNDYKPDKEPDHSQARFPVLIAGCAMGWICGVAWRELAHGIRALIHWL